MYFKIFDTNRGMKSFTVMVIYIVAVHKQAVQRSFKNRHNNISIHLEHNHEQDEKKVKRQQLRTRGERKATSDITSRRPS